MDDRADVATASGGFLFISPVQEHHIDFLLEEEFACNPHFLRAFVECASKPSKASGLAACASIPIPCDESECQVVRSVTTEDGETDVLVIFRAKDDKRRFAILIEDKIRAGFQRDQAKRYQDRGHQGKQKGEWSNFVTCLVSPEKYAKDNKGFDTRVTLEELAAFFCEQKDQRSKFKCGVFERALANFALSGVRIKHQSMTDFRSFYSASAASFFSREEVLWDEPRDAWWGDTWFNFRGGLLTRGVTIVHKAQTGCLDLSFPHTSQAALQSVILRLNASTGGTVEQTGKSAALRLRVTPITDFTLPAGVQPNMLEVFSKVRSLLNFYKANAAEIQANLQR